MTSLFVKAFSWITLDAIWLFDKLEWKRTGPTEMTGSQRGHLNRIRLECATLFFATLIWSAFLG